MINMGDAINWLQDLGIIDFVNAATTVVLALFAFAQIWSARMEQRGRVRAAYDGAWIEFWRLWSISETWRLQDLEEAA